MPWLRLACPRCRTKFAAQALPEGQRVSCPACAAVVSLPATASSGGEWFYASGRSKRGPLSWDHLRKLAAAGQLRPADMVLQKGAGRWTPAEAVPGLFPAAAALPATEPPRRRPPGWLLAVGAGALVLFVTVPVLIALRRAPAPEAKPAAPAAHVERPAPATEPKKTASPEPLKGPEATRADLLARVIERLNAQRRSAGLRPVRLDAALSQGCQAHAVYLLKNADLLTTAAGDSGTEDPGRPGFSAAGRQAARAAMIVPRAPAAAIDHALARLFSRVPLLQPRLAAVGLGAARDDEGWITVLDAGRGLEAGPVVIYPAAGEQGVGLGYSGGPEVAPVKQGQHAHAGFPVTIAFPTAVSVQRATAVLRDSSGQLVAAWLFTPDKPAPGGARNTITLIARTVLRSGSTYDVSAEADVDGRPWRQTWHFTTVNDAVFAREMAAKAVALVNIYRRQAGLEAVRLDPALTQGCAAHAAYLARNADAPSTQGLGGHDEQPDLPGFSEEGRRAGKAAVIAFGDLDPLAAVHGWMATLYHRVPLLHPGLRRVGFGLARTDDGRAWFTVVDTQRGREPAVLKDVLPYPADGQKDVPLAFSGPEFPDPIPESKDGRAGYPITATFPSRESLTSVTGSLTDGDGRDVPAWLSTPEKPANPRFAGHQGTTVALIPRQPLRPATTYRVRLAGGKGADTWTHAWSFTTRGDEAHKLAVRVVACLNDYRERAGLAPVRLDPVLSAGCVAHARYVARNRQHPALRGAGIHDEDPKLPGSSAEGRETARTSDIHLDAADPVSQVDDLMGTAYRRAALLDPALRRIGFGCTDEGGRGWINVLDLAHGRGEGPVFFPADGQNDVPLVGQDRPPGAKAGPVGYPITVTFPAGAGVSQSRASLKDGQGQEVAVWLTDPEHPADPALQQQTICLVPRQPLRPGNRYTVGVRAVHGGRPWQQTWHFTTGAAPQ